MLTEWEELASNSATNSSLPPIKMGCCASDRLDSGDLEIAFNSGTLAIQDKKPTLDSEGFADISLTSNRDSEAIKPQLTFGEFDLQALVTPRFGGKINAGRGLFPEGDGKKGRLALD